MIKVHEIGPAQGEKKTKKRVGRGISGKGGKTAGTGTKGQTTRSKVFAGFEGGQVPTYRRSPKAKGFTNPFRVDYQALNLAALEETFDAGSNVDVEAMRKAGVLKKKGFVKILAQGEIKKALNVSAHAFSEKAKAAIEAAGGTCTVVPMPWKDAKRRPAQGNQHTNR